MSGQRVTFEHGPGRAGIRFSNRLVDGHRHVVPTDAAPLLRQGRLDKRLFDVTTLREFGYTGDSDLPLMLEYPKSGQRKGPAGVRAAVKGTTRVGRDLPGSGLLATRTTRAERAELWSSLTTGTSTARTLTPGIDRVHLDGKRQLSLDASVPQIGAPTAWQQGLDGTGVTVAVLDTGIDSTHPDFAGKITSTANFTDEPGEDLNGHGTHVASTIAGTGARSGGKYRGVAPGAKLAVAKVCGEADCPESNILAGMEWAAPRASVINMSLGYFDEPGVDLLEQAVEDLTAAYGALFVVAAGNRGYGRPETVMSPASADAALAVGSVDNRDQLALTSSLGPRIGDGAIKPDITAPGVNIVAARAANAASGDPVADGYSSMSGTSMATPHVAGAAAILTQQHADWAPSRKKAMLMGSSKPTAGLDGFAQGAGRVDVARAVSQTVTVDGAGVNFGRQEWPHSDDVPISRTLTYRNIGTAPATLALTVEGAMGTFSVKPANLTIPAGGAATATVVADTSGEGTDGYQHAQVVATGSGDVRVGTPVVVNRDVEKYDVTFRHIDRTGAPDEYNHFGSLIRLDRPKTYTITAGAEETVTIPAGTYGLASEFYGVDNTSLLVQPKLVVDKAMTVTLDARAARPVTVNAARADARQAATFLTVSWTTGQSQAGTTAYSYVPGDLFSARIGPAQRAGEFTVMVNSVFARWKNDEEGFRDSPYTYEVAYSRQGEFFTGFEKRISPSELSTVKARYAREADGANGAKAHRPSLAGGAGGTEPVPFSLPFERTEYVGGDGTASWRGEFQQQLDGDTVSSSAGPVQRLTPGTVHRQSWNTPVFAPSVTSDDSFDLADRSGNTISANIPMFGDGAGHWGSVTAPDTSRTALYADGTLIGESSSRFPSFPVPAERKTYRLEQSATRSAPFRLSTSISGAWTFSSAAGDTILPLSTIRFSPRGDAPAGDYRIPVTVDRAIGSAAAANRTLTVDFSTDDGRTWRPATISKDRRTVKVTNPASGFVSLRAAASDTEGNTATMTAIRAYEIR
ncbi:S8 family serine peptidase [Actinoplanes sp. M2I2]|uniref:S8 family serine peptidase n=1 Tax=Actinoplanes sp. M2I2 TaxID=1734444 RepID=UPI002021480B|nr:S8 family serine peptidase [Actinoplanes sp. M2I2]